MNKKIAYFDNASTTPLDPKVFDAMLPYFKENYGNPSNLYEIGRTAKKAILESTHKITQSLNCRDDEFVFTGSATEADNLAIAGIARANKKSGNQIIISNIEHKGINAICDVLIKEGFEVIKIPVNKNGLIKLDVLKEALTDKTILVSITMADSETGTLQQIKEIGKIIQTFRNRGKVNESINNQSTNTNKQTNSNNVTLPYFHSDASQASAYLEIDVNKLNLDLMTLSAHKLGGPKGIGGLYIRKRTNIQPIIYGGGQQGQLRSGTENVPGIVGFGKAVELNANNKKKERERTTKLRDRLEKELFKKIPKIMLNGHKTKRLPNFLNISILDIEGEAMLLHLDEAGIIINTGSACNAENLEPSYVLMALGNPYEFIHGSIRFTLGKTTTMNDVNHVIKYLPNIVKELRKISPLNLKLDQDAKMSNPKAFIGNKTPHFLRK